jgi:hypothetical protein
MLFFALVALFTALFVSEFTVVHEATNRGFGVGGYFYQIQAFVQGNSHGITGGHNAHW